MIKIISGTARGAILETPSSQDIRPTTIRARCSLMDSLSPWHGKRVADICAGSGAVGLEAASRGASDLLFIEKNLKHCQIIENNIAKIQKSGAKANFKVVRSDILNVATYSQSLPTPDIVFIDPPYAESVELFTTLMKNHEFLEWSCSATLIWELPDECGSAGHILDITVPERETSIRRFGSTLFILMKKL